MKVPLFLLALIGASCALQFPYEYTYDYEGRVGMSIPKLTSRVSGLGIKCTLVIQMKSHGVGIAQMKNIMVGDFLGGFHSSHLRRPLPIEYSAIASDAVGLKDPFSVNFLEKSGHVMSVTEGEPEWVTNLKKGAIEVFLLDPLISNHVKEMYTSETTLPSVYTVPEETIFGRCRSIYSISIIPGRTPSEGSQRPSQSSGNMQWWKLLRTIDFDSCNDRVILEHAGYGDFNRTGYGYFDAVSSRGSVGSYILSGEPGAFRVENAIIEGTVVRNSFRFQSEKMESITNQTLKLKTTSQSFTPLKLPSNTKEIRTWQYEVVSPFNPPSHGAKPWVNYLKKGDKFIPVSPVFYLTGIIPTQHEFDQAVEDVERLLEKAAQEIAPLIPAFVDKTVPNSYALVAATNGIREAQLIMTGLPLPTIEKIVQDIFKNKDRISKIKQSLLIDVIAASGSAPGMKVLLKGVDSHPDMITMKRMSTIFMTITNQLTSPVIIPELMQFVDKHVKLDKLEGTQILINFASLLRRVCLYGPGKNYTLPNPIFGDQICKPSFVSEKFVPYLKRKLESSQKVYETLTLIQAISHLGSPETLDLVRPFIFGTNSLSQKSKIIRSTAIYCLARGKLPQSMRTDIMEMLMEVIDDQRQPTTLRQSAVAVLMSWKPHAAIWHKLARQTWREPSQQLAAFIYFTIDTMSISTSAHDRSQVILAKYVRGLAKPFSHALLYSNSFPYSSILPHDKLSLGLNYGRIVYPDALKRNSPLIPREIYALLSPNYGGVRELLSGFSIATEDEHSREKMYSDPHSSAGRMPNERHERKTILTRMMENIFYYVPTDTQSIDSFYGPDGSTYLNELTKGKTFNVTKYLSPMTESFFLPTEIGVPLLGKTSIPILVQSDGVLRLEVPGIQEPTFSNLRKAPLMYLLVKKSTKMVSNMFMSLQAMTPWDRKQVITEITNVRAVNLPIYGNMTVVNEKHVKNITLNIAPIEGVSKFPVVYAHNIPFIAIKPLFVINKSSVKVEPLTIDRSKEPLHKVVMKTSPEKTGLNSELVFEGDTPSPFSIGYLMYYINNPPKMLKLLSSPTAKFWKTFYMVKPESSSTKNISLSLTLTHFGKSIFSPDDSKSSERSSTIPQFSPEDTMEERSQKIKEMLKDEQPTIGLNAQLFLNGSEFRKFDALAVISRKTGIDVQVKKFDILLALMGSPLTNTERQSRAVSLEAHVETPSFEDASQLLNMLKQKLIKQKITGKTTYGKTTSSSSKMSSFTVNVDMSNKRRDLVIQEMSSHCKVDPLNPINHLRTPAIYDQATVDVVFDEKAIPKGVMNATLNFIDRFRGMHYPFVYTDRYMINNPANKLFMKVERPPWSNFYIFKSKSPKENSIVEHVHIPTPLVSIMPFRKFSDKCHPTAKDIILTETPLKTACTISKDEVVTFDGLPYAFEELKCGTVIATDRVNPSNYKVYVHKTTSGTMETLIHLISNSYKVLIRGNYVEINGTPMQGDKETLKNSQGTVILKIQKTSLDVEAMIPHVGMISAKEQTVTMLPLSTVPNSYRGICGDFDGNQNYEMTGPQDCLYTNSTLYTISWTENVGSDCDVGRLEHEKKYVQEFQKNCPHRGDRQKQISLIGTGNLGCYQYVYPVTKKNQLVCVSEDSIRRCKSDCYMTRKETVTVPASCWNNNNAPSEVVEALSRGYLTHPVHEHPDKKEQLTFTKAGLCRPHKG